MPEVIDEMVAELEVERGWLSSDSLRTIYFGGGTPSLLTIAQVERFMSRISELYDVSGLTEVTFEANPDDLSLDYLKALRTLGINRLSLGVQSFDDDALRFMGRRHNANQAIRAVEMAREAGFENVAIDLIFGIAGFGVDVLERSLQKAISLNVEHIAAYHLTIEPGTAFARMVARGELSAVSESVSEAEYELVRRMLTRDGGFEHYEISNYAKMGRRSQHNSSYWQGAEYLGIGPGAHSFSILSAPAAQGIANSYGTRRWACDSIEDYLESDAATNGVKSSRYGSEILTKADRRNEVVMTSLRCVEGINMLRFGEVFGTDEQQKLLSDGARALECGDLEVACDGSAEWLRIPTPRLLRSDLIIEQLFNI